MGYPVYYVPAGDVLPIFFSSFDGGTGASITMTGLAVTDIEIYKDGSATQRASDAGYTLLDTDGIDFDGITGIHGFSIDTGDNTDAGFYAVGAWYHVVVSAVTIDAQTVSFVAAAFRIMAAEGVAGVPDVNVTHVGDTAQTARDIGASVLLSNGTGTGQISLSSGTVTAGAISNGAITAAAVATGAIDADAIADNAIDAGAIATGAITSAKFAAGAIDAAAIATNAIDADALAADAGTEIGTAVWATAARTLTAATNITSTGGTTVPQTGDSFARLGAPAGASVSADIAAIEAQTDDIGAAGAGLTAIPWNAAWDAEVESEANDALVGQNLDHLVKIAVDTNFATTVHLDSVVGQLADAGGTATFDRTTDALEVLGAATAPSAATIADAVWDEVLDTAHEVGGSASVLLQAAGTAADPWLTPIPGSYGAGTAGKILGDNVNATIGSRATQTSVDTIDDFLDTEVAAILTDTNELQTDLVNGGRLDLLIDGIKAKTDLIPASPAATGDIPSAATVADAVWDEAATGHTDAGKAGEQLWTDVDAILVDTGTTLQAEVDGIQTDTEDIQARIPAALVSGRIDASVGAMAAGVVTAAAIATGAIDADALAADAVDEIFDEQIGDSTTTLRQALKILVASLAGKSSGGGTSSITFRNIADTTNVMVLTVDANGNRTAVTLSL